MSPLPGLVTSAVSPAWGAAVLPMAMMSTFWKSTRWAPPSTTRMFTLSPGTSRPATPRTWSTDTVMATRPAGIFWLNVTCAVRGSTNWPSTRIVLAASGAMATLPASASRATTAVAGKTLRGTFATLMKSLAACSPGIPFGMSEDTTKTWTSSAPP